MSDKYLPATVVAAALPKLQEAVSLGDPTAFEAIKQWGFESIARVYDPDPIFRPHHYILKKRAETEWRRMLEAHERRLKEILVRRAEEAWDKDLGHRIDDRTHQATETRRRDGASWDKEQGIDTYQRTTAFGTDEWIREARAMAAINRQSLDAAPPQKNDMDTVREIQAEIAAIERDSSLTSESKHRRTQALNKSIETILGRQR